MTDVYIYHAVRTPRGRGKAEKGALSGIHPQELLAQTLNELARRTGIEKKDVDDVVVGCVSQAGEQGACIARNAVLAANIRAACAERRDGAGEVIAVLGAAHVNGVRQLLLEDAGSAP